MCGRAKLPGDVSEIKLDLKIDWDEIGAYQPQMECGADNQTSGCRRAARSAHAHHDALGSGAGFDPLLGRSPQDRALDLQCPRRRHRHLPGLPRRLGEAGRRCLVIADGYYEWRDSRQATLRCRLGNRGPMTMAGLWDTWTAPDGDRRSNPSPSSPRPPMTLLQPLHGRMPVIASRENWAGWLGETAVE